ncbi:MAG: carboxypeptidase regulatory-like domain-containing protein [Hahellaceae bacterium]|nr:carboxypeptidase regulatory-like domain-containing protein [Hahellaceae bacterium]
MIQRKPIRARSSLLIVAAFLCMPFSTATAGENGQNALVDSVYWLLGGIKGTPISGRVVDAKSGEPIEGVSVLAHWDKVGWHGVVDERLAIVEALTDTEGNYTLPGWGPQLSWVSSTTLMEFPVIYFFKVGYNPLAVGEKSVVIHGKREISRMALSSSWQGKTIPLTPMGDDLAEYAKEVLSFVGAMSFVLYEKSGDCYWKYYPKTISSYMYARNYLKEKGIVYLTTDYDKLPCASGD